VRLYWNIDFIHRNDLLKSKLIEKGFGGSPKVFKFYIWRRHYLCLVLEILWEHGSIEYRHTANLDKCRRPETFSTTGIQEILKKNVFLGIKGVPRLSGHGSQLTDDKKPTGLSAKFLSSKISGRRMDGRMTRRL